jgi:hypothetical protein
MTVQTVKLGRESYVILRKRDYERLRKAAVSEDAQDAATFRRQLARMKQRRQTPIPWGKAKAMLEG